MMRRGFRCRNQIADLLKNIYEDEIHNTYNGNYLLGLENFYDIAEYKLRKFLQEKYISQTSIDQSWKSCKGELYEYAVYKFLTNTISKHEKYGGILSIHRGSEIINEQNNDLAIKNWNVIYPDLDLVLRENNKKILAIFSCKTSLRERLTETAFWKRELQQFSHLRDIKLIFVTTDRDEELRAETNRYIILHIIDYTLITEPQRYFSIMKFYEKKFGNRSDFKILQKKVRPIKDFITVLQELMSG
ncbi:MAG: BsaWI family type II restriction enzyme [candidate division WOR-3 bacterium]